MIISASRRTDIPAFYGEWLFNRLRAGFVLAPNPMNRHQVSRISLDPADVDCIVFWTKNPAPLVPELDRLRDFCFYFQFTLNPYGPDLESNLPAKSRLVDTFRRLADKIGPERVIWRYDPILVTPQYTPAWHEAMFAEYCRQLHQDTRRCTISFYDSYRKSDRNLAALGPQPLDEAARRRLAGAMAAAARECHLALDTCAETIDLREYGIGHAACIDIKLIEQLKHVRLQAGKDKNQRPACGCAASLDIGCYNTCPHGCRYCYANANYRQASANRQAHDPASPLLTGHLADDAVIYPRL